MSGGRSPHSDLPRASGLQLAVVRTEAPLKHSVATWGQTSPHLTLPVSPDPRAEEAQGWEGPGPGALVAAMETGKGRGEVMLNSSVPGL